MRKCPCCHKAGIDRSLLFPNGTSCRYCGEVIEVDAMFYILTVVLTATVMLLNSNFWEIEFLSLICALVLIIHGLAHRYINPYIMPLKRYEDETSL